MGKYLARDCGFASVYADVESSALTNSTAGLRDVFAAMIDYIWYSPKWFSVRARLKLPTAADLRAKKCSTAEQTHVPLLSAQWPSDHLALAALFDFTDSRVNDRDL